MLDRFSQRVADALFAAFPDMRSYATFDQPLAGCLCVRYPGPVALGDLEIVTDEGDDIRFEGIWRHIHGWDLIRNEAYDEERMIAKGIEFVRQIFDDTIRFVCYPKGIVDALLPGYDPGRSNLREEETFLVRTWSGHSEQVTYPPIPEPTYRKVSEITDAEWSEIETLEREGRWIHAVKLIRELTHVSLDEAKDALPLRRKAHGPKRPRLPDLTEADWSKIEALERGGCRIHALKLIRELTGANLIEAKQSLQARGLER